MRVERVGQDGAEQLPFIGVRADVRIADGLRIDHAADDKAGAGAGLARQAVVLEKLGH